MVFMTRLRIRSLLVSCTLLLLALGACTGSDGDGAGAELGAHSNDNGRAELPPIRQFGEIVRDSLDIEVDGSRDEDAASSFDSYINPEAGFLRFDSPLTAEQLDELYVYPNTSGDLCVFGEFDYSDEYDTETDFFANLQYVDAGEVITVSNRNGSWFELLRFDEHPYYWWLEDIVFYGPELDSENPMLIRDLDLPATLDIPGAEFPAFEDVPFPYASPLEGVTVVGIDEDGPTPDTVLRWTASDDPAARILIDVSYVEAIDYDSLGGPDPSGESVAIDEFDTQYPREAYVSCLTEDDGEFRFPDRTYAALASYRQIDGEHDIGMTRGVQHYETRGDALLRVSAESDTVYPWSNYADFFQGALTRRSAHRDPGSSRMAAGRGLSFQVSSEPGRGRSGR